MYLYLIIFTIVWSFSTGMAVEEEKIRALSPQEKEDLIARLKAVQAGIQTFEADFTEVRTLKALPAPITYHGSFYYQRDHLFFMKYSDPVRYILRVKGTEVMIYVIGNSTADIVDLSNVKTESGHTDIFAWDPEKFRGEIYSDAKGLWLKGVPQQPGMPKLNILLNRSTLLVEQFSMIGENSDTTTIMFEKKKINRPLPTEIVNFSLPKGTQLNRLSPP